MAIQKLYVDRKIADFPQVNAISRRLSLPRDRFGPPSGLS